MEEEKIEESKTMYILADAVIHEYDDGVFVRMPGGGAFSIRKEIKGEKMCEPWEYMTEDLDEKTGFKVTLPDWANAETFTFNVTKDGQKTPVSFAEIKKAFDEAPASAFETDKPKKTEKTDNVEYTIPENGFIESRGKALMFGLPTGETTYIGGSLVRKDKTGYAVSMPETFTVKTSVFEDGVGRIETSYTAKEFAEAVAKADWTNFDAKTLAPDYGKGD